MAFKEAQAEVDSWIGKYKEGYWPPLSMFARLSEEIGELARELNHRYGSKPKKGSEDDAELSLEIADCLFSLICLANSEKIDLDEAFGAMMTKLRTRDDNRLAKK